MIDCGGASGSSCSIHTTCAPSTKIQRSPLLKQLGTAVVAEEGAYYLARNRKHRFKLLIDADTFPCTSHNVTAIRPGTGTKRAVFGSHHDAAPISHGALDNASGVACVLEMARLLKNELPEWTIEFVSFDAEEYCIHDALPGGSEAYVDGHRDRKWEFFMNFDSVGTYFAEEMLHVSRPELLPEFDCIYRKAPIANAGDDRNFDRIGVPSMWFSSHSKFMDFHTPLDAVWTVSIEKIACCVAEAFRVTHNIC